MKRDVVLALALLVLLFTPASVDAQVLPPGDLEPLFKLEASGPMGFVTALGFSPDGQTLFAAGWDKVVRTWRLGGDGKFVLDPRTTFRVPIGPGAPGNLNALALSPDGAWLAVGGNGVMRGTATFRKRGQVQPYSLVTPEMLLDQGMIYVFNLKAPLDKQEVRLLRGHRGPVMSLTFAPARDRTSPVLVSASQEWANRPEERRGSLRIWNVEKAESIASLDDLPDPDAWRTPPGLSAWYTASGLRVAAACGDGQLRAWDVDHKKAFQVQDSAVGHNRAAFFLPATSVLVSGSLRKDTGRVQGWTFDGSALRESDSPSISFPPSNGVLLSPWSLAPISARADGYLDHLAVILAPHLASESNRLQIRQLDGKLLAQVLLWPRGEILPVMAASARGRYLAVAGNGEHSIHVHAVADLLSGRAPAPQVLRGQGALQRYASLVRSAKNANEIGVLLSETGKARPGDPARPPASGDLILDVARRKLLDYQPNNWRLDAPALDGWEARVADPKQGGIEIRKDGQRRQIVSLKVNVTDFALLPPRPPHKIALLAIALVDRGEPLLQLYNAETGAHFRNYTGHGEVIRSVAFSADGRLLVSAAEDHTVCVWSLTDLDAILGQRGRIKDLEVHASAQGLQVHSDAPPGLQPKEIVDGVLEDGQLRRFRQPFELYDYLWRRKPGTRVVLQVAGERRPFTLGQGIDSQKPLLTLFVSRGAKAEQREWIGWNALGTYDVSARGAERHLGWHFNTGLAEGPTRFALADQYSKTFYRSDLLRRLFEEGKALPPQPPQPPPPPNMTLWLEGGNNILQPESGNEFVLREAPVVLKLAIDNYPTDRTQEWIESVRWQLDARAGAFDAPANREWSADLSRAQPWKRVRTTARAIVRTAEAEPKEYTRELTFRFQPPPPTIIPRTPLQQVTDKETVAIQADVATAQGEPAEVRVHYRGKVLLSRAVADRTTVLQEDIKLLPGENLIELSASNRDALAGFEEAETARLSWLITFNPPKEVEPPTIALESVSPVLDSGLPGDAQKITAGQPLIVAAPTIRIAGAISSKEDLERAEWLTDEKNLMLSRFDPSKKEMAIDEQLSLVPGVQRIRFRAKAKSSKPAEKELVLDYRPALPRLQVTSPADVSRISDNPQVEWRASLTWPGAQHPCQIVFMVNEQRQGEPLQVGTGLLEIRRVVVLKPGINKLQVVVGNTWKRSEPSAPLQVHFLRPPHIKEVRGPRQSDKPTVDLEADVQSVVAVDDVTVHVNGEPQKVERTFAQVGDLWRVQLKNVPLTVEDRNEIRVWARNAEPALSRNPALWNVVYRPPPKAPAIPTVEFPDIRAPQRTSEPALKIRFHIKAAAPPPRVLVVRHADGSPPLSVPVDVATLRQVEANLFEGMASVELAPRVNRLHVDAGGGEQHSQAVTLSYYPMPLRVELQRLESWRGEDRPIEIPGGDLSKLEAAHGQYYLRGRVIGVKPGDPQLRLDNGIWVYVNGIRQLPAQLDKLDALGQERSFRVPIILGRKSNQIRIEAPGTPLGAGDARRHSLNCRAPAQDQRLHLIVVGLETADRAQLKSRALRAIQATPITDEEFAARGFKVGKVYRPLVGLDANHVSLHQLLVQVRLQIKRPTTNPMNEVVLLYYQGRESVNVRGQFQWDDVSWTDMEAAFAVIPGVGLLFLEVTTEDKEAEGPWPEEARIGVLRYAWRGPQAPKDAPQLFAVLEKMPRAERFRDFADQVRDHLNALASMHANLSSAVYVPEEIGELQLGLGK